MKEIAIKDFSMKVFAKWDPEWLLLAAGDFEKHEFNFMTVAWGALGVLWNKPIAIIFVRPSRYTYDFTEKYDSFTLSGFSPEYKDALTVCGTKSGRDIDKIKASGLTPIKSASVKSPSFKQANLVIECKKIYFDDLNPGNFLSPEIENNYSGEDYHRFYFGEVLKIFSDK